MPRTRLEAIGLKRGLPMIFVHTPKCGGSYIAHAIGYWRERMCITRRHPTLKGHKTYLEFQAALGNLNIDIADFTTFSVIRNPWSWHVSLYHYIRALKGIEREKKQAAHTVFNRLSFSEYLLWLDDLEDEFLDTHFAKNVCDWVIDERGNIAVDFILKQEQLQADLLEMQDRYNLRLKFPKKRINASDHKSYRSYYSASEVDFIAKRHQRDIELFGYAFED